MGLYKEAQNTYQLPETVKGATLESINFEVLVNTIAPLATLSSVTCLLAKDGATTLTLPITITNATLWYFSMDLVAGASMDIEEGLHVGDVETTDSNGVVKKYVKLELQILPSPQ